MGGALPFDNSYARLPERFYAKLPPTPVKAPQLLALNEALAEVLQLDPAWLRSEDGVAMLAGNAAPAGAEPLAMAYAGHQFGGWVPQLGDGRAILLGEIVGADGIRRDIQLKGSGPTPYSRRGDGRAAVGPVLREYLISEAMAALGVPTTRSLAAVATGEPVFRETPLPGAVLTRVARSHIRVGTFQFFYAREDVDGVRTLTDYALQRHEPETAAALADAPMAERAKALLDGVIRRQAALVAQWMAVGFIHGVMNTDNCAISGETIDYGPCAFMDHYDPATVFSSIDYQGRYAYGRQPAMLHWNLAQLATALLPVLGANEDSAIAAAQTTLDAYPAIMQQEYLHRFRAKVGISAQDDAEDHRLISEFLAALQADKSDFTLGFRALAQRLASDGDAGPSVRAWLPAWRARIESEGRGGAEIVATLQAANPARIPRNHRVEHALSAAAAGDMAPFETLRAALAQPYADATEAAEIDAPPRPEEKVLATFCGT
ncbi:MAG: YdiU family protein [Neomegalonema sp.]|nr:YdiU family protein [Neomegalonema sp.]